MSTPTHSPLVLAAVTISPESSKPLTSGELRIGPRRHKHKLICDQGRLCQEFSNVVELSPDTQITLYYTASRFQRKKTQQIDTRRLFESVSASQTQDLSVSQNGIRVAFKCRATEPALPTIQTTGSLAPTTQAILEDCPQYVRCCNLATSTRPTLQFKIPYLGYRKEWCREVKSDQCRLRDRQSGKTPSHLSAMSVSH
ncbi:hypothetical protein HD554DRAFT_235037 [Boletus coccyginus]|nr:hypothetical protein HD554DRAFT_235037 [Boletus coccyginus]